MKLIYVLWFGGEKSLDERIYDISLSPVPKIS